ncbi:MAG: glycosyltransferase family 4 protein [Simkania sp.]|nr:glycosyltransferase family 4 protein [Simkania sp.]
MRELCIDARMVLSSGIGTYLCNLLPLIEHGPFRIRLIIHEAALKKLPWLSRFSLIVLNAPIYSVEEQIKLPILIPKCDVFWSPHYNVPLFPTAAKNRLVTLHDVNHLAMTRHLSWTQRLYARIVMKMAAERSKRIITVSQFSKKEICAHLNTEPEKITVIFPGVDRKAFLSHEDGLSSKTRQHYHLPEKFILFVGNVKPHKNLLGLLKGFLGVLSSLEGIHLVVVGKRTQLIHADKQAEAFVEHSKLVDRVHFLDFVEEEFLPSLYRLAIATVIPSFYEGFGSPAVEAMSSGCALAVSKMASLPEVCAEAAVYFDPHRPEEMGQVLKRLVQQPELLHELREKGLKRSRDFCWEKCADAHCRVLEELCRR